MWHVDEMWRHLFFYIFQLFFIFFRSLASGLYYKCIMIIIYDHNDSGQYYKTTIIIVIDDPS